MPSVISNTRTLHDQQVVTISLNSLHNLQSEWFNHDHACCLHYVRYIITPPARRAWRSYKFASLDFSVSFFYSACRRRGGVLKCPRFCFFLFLFFLVSKVELPLMGYTAVQYTDCYSEPMSTRLLNSISSRICRENTQFNMYTTTSKQ